MNFCFGAVNIPYGTEIAPLSKIKKPLTSVNSEVRPGAGAKP
jgi:hypothetical protein